MHILKMVFFIVMLVVAILLYIVSMVVSEHREYPSMSLEYLMLTPKPLSILSKGCKESPVFVYSSADGSKPSITTLKCTIPMSVVQKQMNVSGFSYVSGYYQKKGVRLKFRSDEAHQIMTSVDYIEYPRGSVFEISL